jgi:formate dehydrogenase major subunit
VDASEIWKGIQEGRIKALYLLGGGFSPEYSEAERAALRSLEFLVVQDILRTEAAEEADLILPGASAFEKDGTFTNVDGRVQRIRPAFRSPGDSKPDWEILKEAGSALGIAFDYSDASSVLDDIAVQVKAFEGLSYDSIAGNGQLLATVGEG